ncbi:unnamed protein product [Staurois parvus]|uniref:Uncharacterized protein n=1 Tax=Staurois parvus TaxID=386267 RepID=A0ABN9A9Y8_9NEOB|nr:unnamed protein product [Staurois parvus]
MFTQSSNQSSPESSKKSATKSNAQTEYQQGTRTWSKQRDLSNSQMSKKQPDKKKEVSGSQTLDPSAVDCLEFWRVSGESLSLSTPETSRLSELHIRSDTCGQPMTSNIQRTTQMPSEREASVPSETLPGLVLEEQQRPSSSSGTPNQHKLEQVMQTLDPIISTSPGQYETLPHTLVHLHTEILREGNSPRQSTLKVPKQYAVKSFKQTLVKPAPKNTRHSVAPPVPPTSSPSSVQRRSEACNPNQTPPKPGCYMSRIKHVDHLSIKQPPTDMNGQVPPPPQNVVEPSNEVSRVLQPQVMEYNYCAKGLKDAYGSVQREASNPCSKWKRELRKASENAESKLENSHMDLDKDSTEQKTADNPKNSSLGRTGSNTSKKIKNDLGIRRVLTNKDGTLGSISSLVTKQPASTKLVNTETRDMKVSSGPAKPPSTKVTGASKREERVHVLLTAIPQKQNAKIASR